MLAHSPELAFSPKKSLSRLKACSKKLFGGNRALEVMLACPFLRTRYSTHAPVDAFEPAPRTRPLMLLRSFRACAL
jgi:hypothetical protein